MTTDMKNRREILSVMWHSRPRLCGTGGQARAPVPHFAAMTLIEILIVMGIMSLIVGAIAVASFGAQRKAQIRNTEALLEKIAQGLGQYKSDHRMYVPSDEDESTYPVWQALDGQYPISVEAKFKHYDEDYGTYTDPRTGEAVKRYQYQDAWKMVVHYECSPPYQSFTLTSDGPDMENGGGDDIEKAE